MCEKGGDCEPDGDAGSDAPVVADDEVPPEAAERAEALHAPAPAGSAACRWRGAGASATSRSEEGEDGEERGLRAGPVTPAPSAAPEDAEGRQHHARPRTSSCSPGTRLERRAHRRARRRRRATTAAAAAGGRQRDAALRALPKVSDDERDLEPLEEDALECEREASTSRAPARCSRTARRSLPRARGEDGVLVVQRLVAARAQDRLAQPLQPEDQQQRPDDEPKRVDREQSVSAGPSTPTITASARLAAADADQRRAPATRDARRQARSSAPPPSRPHWPGTPRERGRLVRHGHRKYRRGPPALPRCDAPGNSAVAVL